MSQRVVQYRPGEPLAFLADVCGALADAIPDTDVGDPDRAELTAVYAEVVCAYARIVRPEFALLPEGSDVWPRVIDHLLERVRQARAGEISLDLTDIAEQLHARIEEVTAPIV